MINTSEFDAIAELTVHKPQVSVVVPVFNAERFLEETIQSVLAQSFTDWELILVDDGSNDDSPGIAERYANACPEKISCVHHTGNRNLGASASRNLGIEMSRGEFVAFLDADDIWLPRHLDTYLALLRTHPEAEVAFGRTTYWYSWPGEGSGSNKSPDRSPPIGQLELDRAIAPPRVLTQMLMGRISVPCTCSLIAKRDAIVRIGGFESSFPAAYDDQVIYAKLFLQCHVVVTDACLDLYRQHPSSMTAKSKDNNAEDSERRKFLEWLSGHLAIQNEKDHELDRALKITKRRLDHPVLNRWRWKISRLIDRITSLHSYDPDIRQTGVDSARNKQRAR